ncbi:MAG: hypothetical protein ACPGVB_01890 [Chitinophagales bacterium]
MKNIHKTTNFNPTAQQSKLTFNWFLSFYLIFFLLLTSTSPSLNAQCTVHNADLGTGDFFSLGTSQVGQTFLACENGVVCSISVGFDDGSQAGDYELYLDTDPGVNNLLPPIAVATLSINNDLVGDQIVIFNLTVPFTVSTGTLYRFALVNTGTSVFGVKLNNPEDYPDGVFVNVDGSFLANNDLDFEVSINNTCPTSNPAAIPTLSEWGLLILALLLMTLGTLYLVQQPRFEQER